MPTTVQFEDPDLYETMRVDKRGRLYLGKDYAEKQIEVCLTEVDG